MARPGWGSARSAEARPQALLRPPLLACSGLAGGQALTPRTRTRSHAHPRRGDRRGQARHWEELSNSVAVRVEEKGLSCTRPPASTTRLLPEPGCLHAGLTSQSCRQLRAFSHDFFGGTAPSRRCSVYPQLPPHGQSGSCSSPREQANRNSSRHHLVFSHEKTCSRLRFSKWWVCTDGSRSRPDSGSLLARVPLLSQRGCGHLC